jgi:hypothetical protein
VWSVGLHVSVFDEMDGVGSLGMAAAWIQLQYVDFQGT